jgi:hypothetical protein
MYSSKMVTGSVAAEELVRIVVYLVCIVVQLDV